LKKVIKDIKNVVVLTGAGVSAESGLNTFRGQNGLWEGHPIEEVASPQGFASNPDLVYEFYNLRRKQLFEVEPNLAHKALSDFEKSFDGNFLLITQNVDDLHERAGSKNILHIHGELRKIRCQKTGDIFTWTEELTAGTSHPKDSSLVGTLRPHIVWFGEVPFFLDEIQQNLKTCDLFISIGTSGVVYPAAALVNWTPGSCRKIEINLENTPVSGQFNEVLYGKATELVPKFFLDIIG